MLVLIDHLSFATADLDTDLNTLRGWGYQMEFRETGLQDLPNKRPYMQHFSGSLEMCLMKSEGNLSVELINHGHAGAEPCNVTPVFAGVQLQSADSKASLDIDGRVVETGMEPMLGVSVHAPSVAVTGSVQCQQFVVATTDLEATLSFWQLLGFRPEAHGEGWRTLRFKAMMGGVDCELILRQVTQEPAPTYLDARGFNCLALFSSDAAKDREKLAAKWGDVSELNDLHVGGKDLRIFWLRGPAGEMVEVIGLKK